MEIKRQTTFVTVTIIILVIIFLLIKPSFTGYSIYQNNEKIKLGYCPTMQEEAEKLANENNYVLVNMGSAANVLHALKNNEINKGLIGRKAKEAEITTNTKETILKSGYTLVSNQKRFIDYSQLPLMEIYTSLEEEFDFPIIKTSKEEVLKKIKEGKVALIYWEAWNDDFELIVVVKGNEKVKDFRGAFLYEY